MVGLDSRESSSSSKNVCTCLTSEFCISAFKFRGTERKSREVKSAERVGVLQKRDLVKNVFASAVSSCTIC